MKEPSQRDNRAVELQGDSPELIAFVLLKNIIQVEKAARRDAVYEKEWLLSTYSECLAAVRGEYKSGSGSEKPRGARK
ncbi:hypothetical protein C9W97_24575 [Salmonella enterica subsp. enterica serovar Enteritidis]|nr:hypothetical protein [Salmonella enterica subsp. enterica]EBW2353130.1 hypothetical protein [Salmonella enterica subsp. enterica serovar Enteritidis]ECI7685856.1 hypothetical protein [Salmonella enterica subsp. enterica serovar Paratyphi A]